MGCLTNRFGFIVPSLRQFSRLRFEHGSGFRGCRKAALAMISHRTTVKLISPWLRSRTVHPPLVFAHRFLTLVSGIYNPLFFISLSPLNAGTANCCRGFTTPPRTWALPPLYLLNFPPPNETHTNPVVTHHHAFGSSKADAVAKARKVRRFRDRPYQRLACSLSAGKYPTRLFHVNFIYIYFSYFFPPTRISCMICVSLFTNCLLSLMGSDAVPPWSYPASE